MSFIEYLYLYKYNKKYNNLVQFAFLISPYVYVSLKERHIVESFLINYRETFCCKMYEPDKTSFLNDYNDYLIFSGNERHYVDSRFEMNDPQIYESAEIGKFQLIAQRLLSKDVEKKYGGGDPQLDYSVLSVGVITLGLIMAVEFVRHLLDHAAKGRTLFKTVLETAYNECK